MTEVGFGKRLENLFKTIGEEQNIEISEFSASDFQKGYATGQWTYEVYQLREIEIKFWNNHHTDSRTVPITVYRDRDREKLENDLRNAVAELLDGEIKRKEKLFEFLDKAVEEDERRN